MEGLGQTSEDVGSARSASLLTEQPHLVVVLESQRPLAGGARYALASVDEVRIGRGDARRVTRSRRGKTNVLELVLPAPALSASHARITRGEDGWVLEDLGSRNGTMVDGERIERCELTPGRLIEMGHAFFVLRDRWPTPMNATADVDSERAVGAPGMVTLVPELTALLEALADIARSKVSVLLLGETGTGKELLARAVHALSGRSGRFVAVNSGALPHALVEALLFGHAKGAFSGALREEPGLVRAADGGTLFLDEIGDLPASSQAALLRVLQESEVTPLGTTRALPVDLRVVSATHRPLDARVAEGHFRADLLARLRGFTHTLPPLAARREDLGVVIAAMLARLAGARARSITVHPKAARALLRYDWPMNARELEQCMAAAIVLAKDGVIQFEHLPEAPGPRASSRSSPPAARLSPEDDKLRADLDAQLAFARGNVAAVARAMGKAPAQIHRWMKRCGLDPNRYR